MSSSTSSSSRNPAYGIALAVLAVVVALELVTRFVLFRMSDDIDRFKSYPARVDAIASLSGDRIVFIGNSATEQSVEPRQFAGEMSSVTGRPAHAVMLVADSSEIVTWQAIANHCIWKRSARPDMLVVTFFGANLQDTENFELGRIAQFFSTPGDWPGIFEHDVTSAAARTEFVLSSFWGTFAFRDRIKQRVLAAAVPNFRDFATALNRMGRRYPGNASQSAGTRPATYHALVGLLERAAREKVKLVLVDFPSRGRGPADPRVAQLAQSYGARYLDMQGVAPLLPEHYVDYIHLTAAGKSLYTPYLARELARLASDHRGVPAER